MAGIMSNILLTGAGGTFILLVAARLLPNDKLRAWGVVAGKAVTAFGAGKLGKTFWEKIEDFLENSSGVFLVGLKEGLDGDDAEEPKPGA